MYRRRRLPLILIAAAAALLFTAGCTRSPEQRYATALDKGKKLMASEDHLRAIIEFQNAVHAKPREAEGYYYLALASLRAHHLKDAIQSLLHASDVNPNYLPAQVKLSELMILTHDEQLTKDAESRLKKVLNDDPSDNDALYAMAATEAQLGNPRDSERYLNQILEKSPRSLRSAVALAQMRAAQGDFANAEQILNKIVQQMPGSSDAQVAMAALYVWMGKVPEAKAIALKAVQLDPKNPPALTAYGSLQVNTGDLAGAEATYKQIAALPQKEHRLAYAGFLARQKRQPEATKELERLFKADKTDRIARSALVAGYLGANRTAEAEAILNAALKANRNDLDALVQQASLYLRNNRIQEAQRNLNLVLHTSPTGQAHYLMSKVYKESGALLLQKQELTEALALSPDSLRVRLELVNAQILANNAQAAMQDLDAAPPWQKQTLAYVLARNWTLLAMGNSALARQNVDKVLAVNRAPDVLLQDAVLKIEARDVAGARANLEEILKITPDDLRALSTLVQMYMSQKQPDQAVARIRQAVAQRPGSIQLKMFLATWLSNHDNEAEGRQTLEASKALEPQNKVPDLLAAGLDIRAGRTDEARQKLISLIGKDPTNIEAHMMLGDIEDSADHPASAIAYYQKVLEFDSGNVRAMNNLAYNMSQDPVHLDDALKFAEKAKGLAPNSPQILDTLGWIYYRKGLYPMAAKEFENALAKAPMPVVKFHLGLAYKRIGRSDEGTRLVAAALAADPTLADKDILK